MGLRALIKPSAQCTSSASTSASYCGTRTRIRVRSEEHLHSLPVLVLEDVVLLYLQKSPLVRRIHALVLSFLGKSVIRMPQRPTFPKRQVPIVFGNHRDCLLDLLLCHLGRRTLGRRTMRPLRFIPSVAFEMYSDLIKKIDCSWTAASTIPTGSGSFVPCAVKDEVKVDSEGEVDSISDGARITEATSMVLVLPVRFPVGLDLTEGEEDEERSRSCARW